MSFNILRTRYCNSVAALAMILTGCFRNVKNTALLIGRVFSFAAMIAYCYGKTGASAAISGGIVGALNPTVLCWLWREYVAIVFNLFISNTATAVLLHLCHANTLTLGVSPYPFLFAVTVAASMCFASPFSTPPNALVMSAGRYKFMDYVKVGLPLQTILMIIMIFVLPLLFPF